MELPLALEAAFNEVGSRQSNAQRQLVALKEQGHSHQYADYAREQIEQAGALLAALRTAMITALSSGLPQPKPTPQPPSPLPPGSKVVDVSEATDAPTARLMRLTGQALHDALTGRQDANGYRVGDLSPENGRAYVNAYGDGGEFYNPSYTQLAQLANEQLAQLIADFATPRDWLAAHGANIETIAPTWDEALALSGRSQ